MSKLSLNRTLIYRCRIVLLLSISVISLIPLRGQVKWQTFESREASFSVLLPGVVKIMEKMVSTPTGEVLVHTVYSESSLDSTGNFLYLVNYFEAEDIDLSLDSSFNTFVFLEDFLENIRTSVDGKVLYSHRDHFDKIPVLEYRIQYQDDVLQMKGRIFLVGQMLYSLQVFTDKKNSLNRNTDSFLRSFKRVGER